MTTSYKPRHYPANAPGLKPGTTFVVLTGEKRPPMKGEWYVSGAIPAGYLALNDLTQVYYIARLVNRRESKS